MLLSNSISVQRVEVDLFRPAEGAVRGYPKKQASKLRKSVKVIGQVVPILEAPEYQIIDHDLVWRGVSEKRPTLRAATPSIVLLSAYSTLRRR